MEENPYSTPESQIYEEPMLEEEELELAGRGARLLAVIIDSIMFFVFAFVVGFVLALTVGEDVVTSQSDLALGSFILVIYCGLNTILLVKKGQTLGKMILKIKIVNPNTSQVPGFVDIILKRYVAFMILSILPLVSLATIIDPFMIFRESRKCWHDDLANTIVVKA